MMNKIDAGIILLAKRLANVTDCDLSENDIRRTAEVAIDFYIFMLEHKLNRRMSGAMGEETTSFTIEVK